MPSPYTIKEPHTISSLPHWIGTSVRDHCICDVYSVAPGQKKRKRPELAVGIDGESINIYDVSASSLIASYLVPPQTLFTCPPSSSRTKVSKSIIERRTYVSSVNTKPKITYFHELKEGPDEVNIKEISQDVKGSTSRVVFVGSVAVKQGPKDFDSKIEVILVKENCEIQCYDGDDLREVWTSPASALFQESQQNLDDSKVEFAQLTDAYSASLGILKNRPDLLTTFPHKIEENVYNPEILILITNSVKNLSRTFHVLSLPQGLAPTTGLLNQRSVGSLLTSSISYESKTSHLSKKVSFSVHVSTGTIQQLENNTFTLLDLQESIPKELYKLQLTHTNSFLRLSDSSIMTSSGNIITLFNPKYRSKMGTMDLEATISKDPKRKRDSIQNMNHNCKLLSYYPKIGTAVALLGSNLIGIQIEGQYDRHGRPRVTGLLIDSVGNSMDRRARRTLEENTSSMRFKNKFQTLKSIQQVGTTAKSWLKVLKPLEESFSRGDCTDETFDQYVLPHFTLNLTKSNQSAQLSEIDKRWVIYALSKIFTIVPSKQLWSRLSISFHTTETFKWLLKHGWMTTPNIESALIYRGGTVGSIRPGELTRAIVDLDPELELLRDLLSKTYLGADELLYSIRCLMENKRKWNTDSSFTRRQREEKHSKLSEDLLDETAMREIEGEKDIEQAERQLPSMLQKHCETLSTAISKLYSFPDEVIVCALKKTYEPKTIVSLIFLLRFELLRGGWTAKYLDSYDFNRDENNSNMLHDNIILIAALLNCCIDAIGAGGWLTGETTLVDKNSFEAEKLVTSLKAEVSIALEGMEEMVYLKSILAETVRYSDHLFGDLKAVTAKDGLAPHTLPFIEDTVSLPLGLKVEKQVSTIKISTGGEVTRRSRRDIGDRKSRKVGKYSREKIII